MPDAPPVPALHSAEYFGDQRDYWWNADFLGLMAERLDLRQLEAALDLGCGVGHWGRLVLPLLSPTATLVGIDRESAWVEQAAERARGARLADRMSYRASSAEALPFHDDAFDLVTCQTVLMHVRDPRAVLREARRVLAPGGLLLAVEPNNIAGSLLLGSTASSWPVERILDLVRLQLVCHRGKRQLGEGNSDLGDLLPGYLSEEGWLDVRVHLSDKASTLIPPYATREQQALRDQLLDWADRGFWIWDRQDTQRYFLAGGGEASELERLWAGAVACSREIAAALRDGTEHTAGGATSYLVSARKPAR